MARCDYFLFMYYWWNDSGCDDTLWFGRNWIPLFSLKILIWFIKLIDVHTSKCVGFLLNIGLDKGIKNKLHLALTFCALAKKFKCEIFAWSNKKVAGDPDKKNILWRYKQKNQYAWCPWCLEWSTNSVQVIFNILVEFIVSLTPGLLLVNIECNQDIWCKTKETHADG